MGDAFKIESAESEALVQRLSAELLRLLTLLESISGTAYNIDLSFAGGDAADIVTGEFDAALAVGQTFRAQFEQLGGTLMQGMANGMQNFSGMLKSIMFSIMSSLISIGIKAILPGSPSKVTTKWGESIVEGIAVGLQNGAPQMQREWQNTLDLIAAPTLDVQVPVIVQDFDALTQQVDLFYGRVPAAPELTVLEQRIDWLRNSVPPVPDLEHIQQSIELLFAGLPPAPDFGILTQQIELIRGSVPPVPDLEPLQWAVEFDVGALPVVPELGAAGTVPTLAGTVAAPLDPVINVYVDNLFADPQAEARKVGSQVYLREGFTVARESGFNG